MCGLTEWKAIGITQNFQNAQSVSFWHIAGDALPWQRERMEIFTVRIHSVGCHQPAKQGDDYCARTAKRACA
jgi:hypothetical protein